ncbi:DUF2909 family protein [Halomonas sp. NO4]|uniref:DUF2909 family protein n=1 Tax=Halomonas sp. NO4 TaxID=2484813 RepID=UPI0013D5748B|nr:DUF2909 family protein [Halomonas sp. NO4]
MLLKTLIAIVFVAIIASMAAGAGFLLRDDTHSRRLLLSLKIRIALTVLLLALLLYGFFLGGLGD